MRRSAFDTALSTVSQNWYIVRDTPATTAITKPAQRTGLSALMFCRKLETEAYILESKLA